MLANIVWGLVKASIIGLIIVLVMFGMYLVYATKRWLAEINAEYEDEQTEKRLWQEIEQEEWEIMALSALEEVDNVR